MVYVGIKQNQEKNNQNKALYYVASPPPPQHTLPQWCSHYDRHTPLLLPVATAAPPRLATKLATSAAPNPQLLFPSIVTIQAYRSTAVIQIEGKFSHFLIFSHVDTADQQPTPSPYKLNTMPTGEAVLHLNQVDFQTTFSQPLLGLKQSHRHCWWGIRSQVQLDVVITDLIKKWGVVPVTLLSSG